ncbi:MAG: tetratricopeptide repeat protein [Planctomycetota bacterium]
MLKKTPVLVLSIFLCCPVSAARGIEQSAAVRQQLYSPSISRKFYDIACELANSKDVAGPRIEQAMAFLTAAMSLDSDAGDVQPLLIELACRETGWDYSSLVYGLLVDYVDESADLEVANKAVEYLLEQVNSREGREKLLERMMGTLGGRNKILSSKLATMLGILKAEKADLDAAESYLMQAYKDNRYNWLAFAKLAEIRPDRIGPAIYLERLRLAIRENPSDIEAAIAFSQHAERLELYETSAAAYKYCADLFDYLYPSETLPARIFLPWAISSYNSEQNQSQCLEIAKRVRQEGGFDLRLESIAGKAAIQMGDTELASLIFQAVEEKTQRLLALQGSNVNSTQTESPAGEYSQQDYNKQLAWFYSFVLPVPNKALSWANKAFAIEPNSPVTAAILSYALTMNDQIEWAKPLVNNFEKTQVADLTQALIQLAEGQDDLANETLQSAIARDPGSFAAERAKEILTQQGRQYVRPAETNAVLPALQNVFGQTLVPVFTPPERMVMSQLRIQGSVFPYGSEFSGIVAITNLSSEPLVISDNSLFRGNIRIDADISGDLSIKVPNLVLRRQRKALMIESGRDILIPVRLFAGELRKTLLTYPQASLDIEFTLYIDPVITNQGKITNRLIYIEPIRASIKRPGIEFDGKYLRDRFNSILSDPVDRKISTAQLFAGLLKEQYAMSNRTPPYRFVYAEWMTPLLKSALSHKSGLLLNPADDEWVVKVHTMAEMLSLPLDHELISSVAENMNNPKWPVRMMAIYLLTTIPDSKFNQVLDWTAKNDPSKTVRDMAIVLGRDSSGRQKQL